MSTVRLTDVTHRYPTTTTTTVDHVSFSVAPGELVTIFGPPKSGKSTLVRMIHGMERPVGGTVEISGIDVTALSPMERGAMMAFESYALYPHMTLQENMVFALQVAGVRPQAITQRVNTAATLLGFAEHLEKKPEQVSAAIRQAVALGRAMVRVPAVLLVDDPLATLHESERVFSTDKFVALQQALDITTLVTSSRVETTLALGARTLVLQHGRLVADIPADALAPHLLTPSTHHE